MSKDDSGFYVFSAGSITTGFTLKLPEIKGKEKTPEPEEVDPSYLFLKKLKEEEKQQDERRKSLRSQGSVDSGRSARSRSKSSDSLDSSSREELIPGMQKRKLSTLIQSSIDEEASATTTLTTTMKKEEDEDEEKIEKGTAEAT